MNPHFSVVRQEYVDLPVFRSRSILRLTSSSQPRSFPASVLRPSAILRLSLRTRQRVHPGISFHPCFHTVWPSTRPTPTTSSCSAGQPGPRLPAGDGETALSSPSVQQGYGPSKVPVTSTTTSRESSLPESACSEAYETVFPREAGEHRTGDLPHEVTPRFKKRNRRWLASRPR